MLYFLGDSPASEFHVSTFRNTLFHQMEQRMCSETSEHKTRRRGISQKRIRVH